MTAITLAIDFGTSRTKVGWRDKDGQFHVLKWKGQPYLSSVFHLPTGCSEILVGDEAQEAIEDDPQGGVENLKRWIIEMGRYLATHPDRTDSAEALVAHLFCEIRKAALAQIPELKGQLPESVVLTQPAQVSSQWRDLLEQGADAAGFLRVEPLKEPIAAARGWLYAQGKDDATVLVLDCGGGTTDWAVVEMRNGRLSLSQQFRAQSVKHDGHDLGGSDVDRALLEHVRQSDGEIVGAQSPRRLLQRLKRYKDQVLSGQATAPLRVGGRALQLDEAQVRQIYQRSFADPLMMQFVPKLEDIAATYPKVEVLLTGGGSNSELTSILKRCTQRPVHEHKERALSVLYGSLATPASRESPAKEQPKAPEPPRPPAPQVWDTPDLHGASPAQVAAWQLEVANQLGVPVKQQDTLKDGTPGPEMILIPPGRYLMGSSPDEPEREEREGPQHQVTLTKPFYLGQHALSFKHYDHYCEVTRKEKPGDSGWGRGSRPTIHVSWEDAKAYCQWLSQQTGHSYRLPTEAQWEYACRAGSTGPFWWGSTLTTEQANYNGNHPYNGGRKGEYRAKTVPVESFSANPWGLYQMHGNVWEWCEDWYADKYTPGIATDPAGPDSGANRVLRGGSWYNYGRSLRSANRDWGTPGLRGYDFGCRLARGPSS